MQHATFACLVAKCEGMLLPSTSTWQGIGFKCENLPSRNLNASGAEMVSTKREKGGVGVVAHDRIDNVAQMVIQKVQLM